MGARRPGRETARWCDCVAPLARTRPSTMRGGYRCFRSAPTSASGVSKPPFPPFSVRLHRCRAHRSLVRHSFFRIVQVIPPVGASSWLTTSLTHPSRIVALVQRSRLLPKGPHGLSHVLAQHKPRPVTLAVTPTNTAELFPTTGCCSPFAKVSNHTEGLARARDAGLPRYCCLIASVRRLAPEAGVNLRASPDGARQVQSFRWSLVDAACFQS